MIHPTRPHPIDGHFFTHDVRCIAYFTFRAQTLPVQCVFVFRTDGRDNMCENNDHQFGRGLVDQLLVNVINFKIIKLTAQAMDNALISTIVLNTRTHATGTVNAKT